MASIARNPIPHPTASEGPATDSGEVSQTTNPMSDEAAKLAGAAGPAGGGGNADALYNQGVIAWNGNDFAKAQELFSSAVKANEKHAEARFMLGQANLNLGKLPEAAKEFETYLKLAPNGPNAEKAKQFYDSLKQYIK